MSLGEVPPNDVQAEMDLVVGVVTGFSAPIAVGGSEFEALVAIVESLDARDFYRTHLGLWWGAVQEISLAGEIPDLKKVREVMDRGGPRGVEAFSIVAGHIEGLETIPYFTPPHLEQRATAIRDRAVSRRLREAALRAIQKIDAGAPSQDCLEYAEQAVVAVRENTWVDGGDDMIPVLDGLLRRLRGEGEADIPVPLGFASVDSMLDGGLRAGNLMILAGRPGMGKSSLLANVASHVIDLGVPVLWFTMEMTRSEVLQFVVASRSSVPLSVVKGHGASEEHLGKIADAGEAVIDRLFVNDKPGLTPAKIRSHARGMKRRKKIGLVLLDHIGLVHNPGRSRENEVGEVSRELKRLAKELDCPVIALSQLNRGVEAREDKKPRLSDLRDSGSIEQDADVVGLLFRPAYYWPDAPEFDGKVVLDIAKHRGGRTGKVHLAWNGDCVQFSSASVVAFGGSL